jgi:hypothetical protein
LVFLYFVFFLYFLYFLYFFLTTTLYLNTVPSVDDVDKISSIGPLGFAHVWISLGFCLSLLIDTGTSTSRPFWAYYSCLDLPWILLVSPGSGTSDGRRPLTRRRRIPPSGEGGKSVEGLAGRVGGGAAAPGSAGSGFSPCERAGAAAEVLRGKISVVGGLLLDAWGSCNWASAEVSGGVSKLEMTGSGLCRRRIPVD